MDKRREEIRKKVAKRIIPDDIPFGVPEDGKVYKRLTEEEHQNIKDIKEEIRRKMEGSKR